MKSAVYPGTFDPITNGHIDIIRRSLKLFHRVVIAVAPNPKKAPLFDINDRIFMIKEATKDIGDIEVEPFDGLLVEYTRNKGADAIIRGLRAMSDFEYEFQMALTNRRLAEDIETVFLMPSEKYSFLSSTLIKEAASLGADLSSFVPRSIAKKLKERLQENESYG